MKKLLLCLMAFLSLTSLRTNAQDRELKKVISLEMPGEDGSNGAGIAYDPVAKKYFAAFAGNMTYPLAVFDSKGKLLSDASLTTMADVRGLWYNPNTKKICGNAYDDGGWFCYVTDKSGMPTDIKIVKEGLNQPSAQSVGVYDAKGKKILFLNQEGLEAYDESTGEQTGTIKLHIGYANAKEEKESNGNDAHDADEPDAESARKTNSYNMATAVFTGIPGKEIGLLNIDQNRVELYNIKTGYRVQSLKLPADAVIEANFNFAYANGICWLFNKDMRTWVGYK